MTHALLKRLLKALGICAFLLTGCSTVPVSERTAPVADADTLYAMAREAYAAGDHFVAAERLIVLARRGDPRAQYALGYMYYRGQGVLGDRARALELIRQSAAQGNAKARQALVLLEGRAAGAAPLPGAALSQPLPQPPLDTPQALPEPAPPPPVPEPAATEPPPEAVPSAGEPGTAAEAPRAAAAGEAAAVPFSVDWLRRQDGAQFTIQLIGGSSAAGLQGFVQRHGLGERAGVVETRRNGDTWYVVLYGVFADLAQAREALRALPEELRRERPWIRPLRDVQELLPPS